MSLNQFCVIPEEPQRLYLVLVYHCVLADMQILD